MKNKMVLAFVLTLFTSSVFAKVSSHLNEHGEVTIAFFRIFKPNGEIVALEPNGQFAHIALKYKDWWYHAAPGQGVTRFKTLSESGFSNFEIVELSFDYSLSEEDLFYFLGRPYDREFLWSDTSIYCSELIAKLLDISPQPMYFDPRIWPSFYTEKNGLPGMSPDKIYKMLIK